MSYAVCMRTRVTYACPTLMNDCTTALYTALEILVPADVKLNRNARPRVALEIRNKLKEIRILKNDAYNKSRDFDASERHGRDPPHSQSNPTIHPLILRAAT